MSLWYQSEGRWLETCIDRDNIGCPVLLCCPGPSLATVKDMPLRGRGRIVAAINKAYPTVKPDIWIGMDMPTSYDRNLWAEPMMKITNWGWRLEHVNGRRTSSFPFTYFAELDDPSHPNTMLKRLKGKVQFAWHRTTMMGALHILMWMGAKQIFLVGCDMGGTKDYCDDTHLPTRLHEQNLRVYEQQIRETWVLAMEAAMADIQIFSATPDSPLNTFLKYVPLADVLKGCERNVEVTPLKTLHVREGEWCMWKFPVVAERGIVTGVVAGQEWMLPNWYASVTRHGAGIPIAFADFGMSADWLKWCQERGQIIDVKDAPAKGWFRKPFAIVKSQFNRVLWLDLDTVAQGSIGSIFDKHRTDRMVFPLATNIAEPKWAASRDHGWFEMCPDDCKHICSGMLLFSHGEPLVVDWTVDMVDPQRHKYRGDQESLVLLAHEQGIQWTPFDVSEMSLFLRGSNPAASIIHYAGIPAKEELRKALSTGSYPTNGQKQATLLDPLMGKPEVERIEQIVSDACRSKGVVNLLEIGVRRGGTARNMMRVAVANGARFTYVGVDPQSDAIPGFPPELAKAGNIHLICAESALAVDAVKRVAPDGFDLVVIDGCHCAKCAQLDVDNYGPMVVPGGHMVLHDVAEGRQTPTERQPNTPHLGVMCRVAYLNVRALPEWVDCGETSVGQGLAILQRREGRQAHPSPESPNTLTACTQPQPPALPDQESRPALAQECQVQGQQPLSPCQELAEATQT